MARKSKAKDAEQKPAEAPRTNSDLTDAERQALFLQGVAEIEREQARKAELVNPIDAKIKLARKRMKAEGFQKFQVDDALRRRKMEPEEVENEFKAQMDNARWCGFQIGYQPDMFDTMRDRAPLADRARNDGKIAGMRGDDCKVPERYSPESEAGQVWVQGWHEGQAVLASAFAKRKTTDADELAEEGEGMPDAEGDESVREAEAA